MTEPHSARLVCARCPRASTAASFAGPVVLSVYVDPVQESSELGTGGSDRMDETGVGAHRGSLHVGDAAPLSIKTDPP
jgi:hypothetical protein